jgi:hypothetical protein
MRFFNFSTAGSSSISIATMGLATEESWFNSRQMQQISLSSTAYRPILSTTNLISNGYQGSFLGSKPAVGEANHLFIYSTVVEMHGAIPPFLHHAGNFALPSSDKCYCTQN